MPAHRRQGMPIDEFVDWILNESTTTDGQCKLWTRYVDPGGNPRVSYEGKSHYVRHILLEFYEGPRPEGMSAASTCGNKLCINPKHIAWLSHQATCIQRSKNAIKNGRFKMPAEMVPAIRHMHANGKTCKQIAATLNMSYQTVHRVINRKSWNWL